MEKVWTSLCLDFLTLFCSSSMTRNLPPICTSITGERILDKSSSPWWDEIKLNLVWGRTWLTPLQLLKVLIRIFRTLCKQLGQFGVADSGVSFYTFRNTFNVYLWTATSLLHQFICDSWEVWQWGLLLTSSAGSPGPSNRPQQRWLR